MIYQKKRKIFALIISSTTNRTILGLRTLLTSCSSREKYWNLFDWHLFAWLLVMTRNTKKSDNIIYHCCKQLRVLAHLQGQWCWGIRHWGHNSHVHLSSSPLVSIVGDRWQQAKVLDGNLWFRGSSDVKPSTSPGSTFWQKLREHTWAQFWDCKFIFLSHLSRFWGSIWYFLLWKDLILIKRKL